MDKKYENVMRTVVFRFTPFSVITFMRIDFGFCPHPSRSCSSAAPHALFQLFWPVNGDSLKIGYYRYVGIFPSASIPPAAEGAEEAATI